LAWTSIARQVLVLLALGGMAQAAEPLTREEKALVDELGFDAALMQKAKASGTHLSQLVVFKEDGVSLAPGILLHTPANQGKSAVQALRRAFAGTEYGAWLNEESLGRDPERVAILKTRDDYTYLAIARPHGADSGITYYQVLARYREWAPKYGLVLTGADGFSLSARITQPPANWEAFAAEVARFCPGILEEPTGDVPSLARQMRESRELDLWWE
jgi:hypothetical protein